MAEQRRRRTVIASADSLAEAPPQPGPDQSHGMSEETVSFGGEYDGFTKTELKEMAELRGLSVSGNKTALIARLEG